MGQEAGSGDVLALLVRKEAVGSLDVVADGTEDFLVVEMVCADGNYPFDAMAGRAGEKEGGGELRIPEEHFPEHRHVRDVVEVQAEEVRGKLDVGVPAAGEGAAEGDIVEVIGLETGGLGLVCEGAEMLSLLLGVVAAEVTVHLNEGDVLEGNGVAHGALEEGDVGRECQALNGFLGVGEPGHHSSPSRSLKSCMAISTSTTIFLPFCMQAGARKPSL